MILKDFTTPNGALVKAHAVKSLTANDPFTHVSVSVFGFATMEAYNAGASLVWNNLVTIPIDELLGENLVGSIENWLATNKDSPLNGGEVVVDFSESLEVLKERKRAEVTRQRLAADADHFIYTFTIPGSEPDSEPVSISKNIRTADKDMVDLLTTNSYVTLFGEFDEDWPGGWKAMDNSYVAISTVEGWKPFFKAMYKKGIANFKKSQVLKAQIDAATTAEQVAEIRW